MGRPTTVHPTLFLAVLLSAAAPAWAESTIEVFTVAGMPVTEEPPGTAVIELDALAWRSGIPEMAYPEALIPGKRELGQPGVPP